MAYYTVLESVLSEFYICQFVLVAQLSFSSLANIPLLIGVRYEGRGRQIPQTRKSVNLSQFTYLLIPSSHIWKRVFKS